MKGTPTKEPIEKGKAILFMGMGLAHYHNALLNKMQCELEVRIVNIVAASGQGHILPGVYQTEKGVEFEVVRLRDFNLSPRYHTFIGLGRAIRSVKPAIIVCTDFYFATFLFNIPAILAARQVGAKLIMKSIPYGVRTYEERLADFRTKFQGWRRFVSPSAHVERLILAGNCKLYQRADAHVVYVDAGRDLYKSYGVPPDRIFAIYNSPDTDMLLDIAARIRNLSLVLPPSSHRIIHVGRLVAEKRVDLLLKAVEMLTGRFPDLELVVIGDGPERGNLETLVVSLGLASRVRFVGPVYDPALLGRYLQASTVYVLAGRGGLAINDAMCFGKPIVCSVYEGVEKDLVENGVNGYFFRAGDASDLADKLAKVLGDPDLAIRMGRKSEEIIRTRMNIHTLISRYAAAFRYVLSAR